jgi:predicted PurR-regulated permease PerM
MSLQKPPGRVDDFTSAFLVSFGILIFIVLLTISIVLGFAWAIAMAFACNKGLTWFNSRA